jgi:hypothetical protein
MARLPYLEADQVAPVYRDMLKRSSDLVLTIAFYCAVVCVLATDEDRQRTLLQRGTAAVPDPGSGMRCA